MIRPSAGSIVLPDSSYLKRRISLSKKKRREGVKQKRKIAAINMMVFVLPKTLNSFLEFNRSSQTPLRRAPSPPRAMQ